MALPERPIRTMHLFAGAGGGILGDILLGHTPVCAVEIDTYCQRVLLQRQRDGILPRFPIWDDVRTFDGRPWRGSIDILAAGFPCQPFSNAGKRKTKDDARNMWPDTIRIIREVGPGKVLLENVPGLLSPPKEKGWLAFAEKRGQAYFGVVLRQLAESGYVGRWACFSGYDVRAPQERQRVFVVAHADSKRRQASEIHARPIEEMYHQKNEDVAYWARTGESIRTLCGRTRLHPTAEYVGVVDGLAERMDRLKAAGNGQIPAVVAMAWKLLNQQEP